MTVEFLELLETSVFHSPDHCERLNIQKICFKPSGKNTKEKLAKLEMKASMVRIKKENGGHEIIFELCSAYIKSEKVLSAAPILDPIHTDHAINI